jgi:TPR repeat protein
MLKTLLAALLLFTSAVTIADMEQAQLAFKKGDHAGAIKEFTALGNAGNISAQLILGALYSKGGVIPRNDRAAAEWFQKAAQLGNRDAQYLLGNLYEDSQLSKNYPQATLWYLKAAQKGSDRAQVRLGYIYSHGLGLTQNYNEAVLWYGKAALQGNAEAQHSLGLMYALGKGLPKNDQLAIGWLTKAAAQHYADSQLLLGSIYEDGTGTDKKPVLAYALYDLAVTNKPTVPSDAIKKRYKLAQELSPQQMQYSKLLIVELNKPNNFSKAMASYAEKSDQMFRFFDRPEKQ